MSKVAVELLPSAFGTTDAIMTAASRHDHGCDQLARAIRAVRPSERSRKRDVSMACARKLSCQGRRGEFRSKMKNGGGENVQSFR